MNRSGAPTTYKRITPDRGCGFILERIWDLTEDPTKTCPPSLPTGPHPTKQDIYRGTKWANRPGFASLLWSSLIKDGLIESDNGMQKYKCYNFFKHSHIVRTRAAGHYSPDIGYTVRYHLTPKGRGILIDMMERRVLRKAEKQAFCERNGIEFGTGRVLNTVGSVAEYDAKKDAIPAPPNPAERDILEKEALDCAKLAADYVGDNQKLHAEKSDMNARLKKIVARLEWLEDEISDVKSALADILEKA